MMMMMTTPQSLGAVSPETTWATTGKMDNEGIGEHPDRPAETAEAPTLIRCLNMSSIHKLDEKSAKASTTISPKKNS